MVIPFAQEFNYAKIVAMMIYLCNNSRPDVSFTVNQYVRYTHNSIETHTSYFKYLGRYLKATHDKFLILNPRQTDLKITCRVDTDFASL